MWGVKGPSIILLPYYYGRYWPIVHCACLVQLYICINRGATLSTIKFIGVIQKHDRYTYTST